MGLITSVRSLKFSLEDRVIIIQDRIIRMKKDPILKWTLMSESGRSMEGP